MQVENQASRKSSLAVAPRSSLNLADEVQTLLTRLTATDEEFVQSVNVQLRRSPTVVLFTKDQIADIRTFCSKESNSSLRSVLSFDRTFNLSSLFVTVMVFRQLKVVRKKTQESPIFVGPLMLHGDGKYETYNHFFSTVNGALHGCGIDFNEFRILDSVVTGSDEETALVNAASTVFASAGQLYCMIHCKDNVRHHLTSVGMAVGVRETILSKLFGSNGVADAHDDIEEENRTTELLQFVRQQNADVTEYLQGRVLPKIRSNNMLKWKEPWIGQRQWNNNNCESANHMLKVQVKTINVINYNFKTHRIILARIEFLLTTTKASKRLNDMSILNKYKQMLPSLLAL